MRKKGGRFILFVCFKKPDLQSILNDFQLGLASNIQKMIIGTHPRSLILESSEHLLYFISFVLSL